MSGLLKYLLFFALLIVSGCEQPPVNWNRTFDSKDKSPYGTYILRKELYRFFPNEKINDIKRNTEDFFDYYSPEEDELYMFISDGKVKNPMSWKSILNHVEWGGWAFIAVSAGNETLTELLDLEIHEGPLQPENKSVKLSVEHPEGSANYIFQRGVGSSYISGYNPDTTDILGFITLDGVEKPNLAQITYGAGAILISTEPIAFTNYHMLKKDHYRYVEDVFSYLDPMNIWWDNARIYSRLRSKESEGGFFESLGFIFKNEPLRKAFVLLLILGLLYLLFNTRRRQRPVPILLPYSNYKLDFAKTLAELYRYEADHTAMVKYKIRYFLEQLRLNYNITIKDTEGDFSGLLAAKSGADQKICEKLVTRLGLYRQKNYLDRDDFFQLQSLIQQFNQNSIRHGRKPQ